MRYLVNENLNKGCIEYNLKRLEQRLDFEFPVDFRDFMLESNGYEGEIGKDKEQYLVLWSLEDIAELNEAYGVDEFSPELLLIGSDGGEIAYAYDKRDRTIVMVPFIGMNLAEIVKCGNNLREFLEYLVNCILL